MADIVSPAPWRALDANGNPVAAAQARFFRQGTTTPLTVYSDEAGENAHPVPLLADSNGVFPIVFDTSAFNVKVEVRHPSTNALLPGYPVDFARTSSTATGSAASLTFSPTAEIPETNTQAAIERVQQNWVAAKTGADAGLVSGTAGTAGNLATWNADGDLVNGPRILDEDDMASNSANDAPSQQSVKAYVDGRTPAPPTLTWTSWANGAQSTVAHGRASAPTIWFAYMECTSDDAGFSVGAIVPINYSHSASGHNGATTWADGTNIYLRVGSAGFNTYNSTGTYTVDFDPTKWTARVRIVA